MNTTPYMPESARAAMPNTAVQPLPPYLLADFQQSLDRSRPHELTEGPYPRAKPLPPNKRDVLQYRYLDTGDTVTVPNIWYNQTVEMRLHHWEWESKHRVELVTAKKKELQALLAKGLTPETSREVREKQWTLQAWEDVLTTVQAAYQDVKAGTRFV